MVDFVNMASFEDHDVDEDPIIVLPCGHFYATSTLDGHLGMNEVYERGSSESNEYVSVKGLKDANINEKPKSCPDCRSVIRSIYRYGRVLRMSGLRALERKHLMSIDQSLGHLNRMYSEVEKEGEAIIAKLKKLERRILMSPMTKVYDACSNRDSLEVPIPPQRQLIQTLELRGLVYSKIASNRGDEDYANATGSFHRALKLADATGSTRSGARIRLNLCSLFTKFSPDIPHSVEVEAFQYLTWVINMKEMIPDMANEALKMKAALEDPSKEMKMVLKAMNIQHGYDYGTSWSSHWFECPNGHPYFIGECGGAMQESRCIECGAPVGGRSHSLNSTNREAGGLVREVMASL
jgi:hypothetical protein